MTIRPTLLGAAALFVLVGPALAQPKDPAELLPADTLAYLELREPGPVAREVQGLIKGSDLENMPATLARFRAHLAPGAQFWRLQDVGVFGLMFSPEVLAEAGRLRGAAVAVTGIGKDGEPDVVAVVLAGDSHGPTFVLRAYLTMDNLRTVGQVEGVTLFRAQRTPFMGVGRVGGGGPPPAPRAEEYGPVYALLSDTVIIGSTTHGVEDVIRRIKGKAKGPTLAEDAAFRTAGELRSRPGFFGYANVAALGSKVEELLRQRGDRMMLPATGLLLTELVSHKALKTAVASLTLHQGEIDLRAHIQFNARQPSPLLEVLPSGKADLQVLHAIPKDSLFTATIALPDGEKRWHRFLALADAIAKKFGAGDQPVSKQVEAVEGTAGLKFGPDVFGKIAGATLAVLPPAKGVRNPEPTLLLVVEAVDADAARSLEEVLPKLVGLAGGGEAPSPTTERVQGQRVRSLPGDALPWRSALHYGRQGKLLVLGQERRVVARALVDSGKQGGLLGQEAVAATLRDVHDPFAVAVWPVGKTLLQMFALRWSAAAPAPAAGGPVPAPPPPAVPGGGTSVSASDEKLMQEFTRALDPVPPLVISLTREPGRLSLHLHQPDLRGTATQVINVLIQGSLNSLASPAMMRGVPVPTGATRTPLPPRRGR